jgi:zinc transporter ZupT
MEATTATRGPWTGWLAALVPLALLGALIAFFLALDAPGLERNGIPVEEVAVERTELRPGEIELTLQNDGPDAVRIEQAIVNDAFAAFERDDDELGRLDRSRVTIEYPWIEGEAYEVVLLTATGGTVDTSIDVAAETPEADAGFYGLMGLIGLYVGIIPIAVGMLWLPWMRQLDRRWLRFVLALTIGLLVFLGLDAAIEGLDLGASGAESLGGGALMWLGAGLAYLLLAAVDGWLERRGSGGERVALLVAIGIGLHNLGEGLVIGSAYAVGSLALGAALVVGFAIHNTTEGLAIVAPVAEQRPRVARLAALGLIAGAPAILGAWIGASAFDPSLAAFMFGVGVGAIARVVVQIAPQVRDGAGRLLHPLAAAGLAAGLALMYVTGLLISV